jgi:hypothetical protein
MVGGRARWVERMRLAKARGLIAKFPNGRRSRGAPPRSKDRNIAKAQRMIEEINMARSAGGNLPQPDTPTSPAEAYFHAGGRAIEVAATVLASQIDFKQLVDPEWLADPEHRKIAAVLLKAASLQTNLALGIISGQIRIDEARLRMRESATSSYDEMFERLPPAEKPLEEILAEVASEEPPGQAREDGK